MIPNPKIFEFSDKFQRCAVVHEGGNRKVTFAEEDHDFCFVSGELEPFETCIVIEFVQLECYIGKRVIDWMSILYITGYLLPT